MPVVEPGRGAGVDDGCPPSVAENLRRPGMRSIRECARLGKRPEGLESELGDHVMKPRNSPPPMLAKEAQGGGGSGRARRPETELPPEVTAEAAVERILGLLEKDLYLPAREVAAQAIERFPDHPRLKTIWRVFDNRGKARIAPGGPEPDLEEQFEWLRNPPDWAHGKWVALVGSEVVAVGETLREVAASARSQKLARTPLVHRID